MIIFSAVCGISPIDWKNKCICASQNSDFIILLSQSCQFHIAPLHLDPGLLSGIQVEKGNFTSLKLAIRLAAEWVLYNWHFLMLLEHYKRTSLHWLKTEWPRSWKVAYSWYNTWLEIQGNSIQIDGLQHFNKVKWNYSWRNLILVLWQMHSTPQPN